MNDIDWAFAGIVSVIVLLLLAAGYRAYEERQITEIVHVKVTDKGAYRSDDTIVHVDEHYSYIVPGELHYIVYTPGEAFEVSEDLYGGIETGEQSWKVSGVKGSFWTKHRWIVELM